MEKLIDILFHQNELMILNIEAHIQSIREIKKKIDDNTTKLSTLVGANKDIIEDEIGYLSLKMIELNVLLDKIRELIINK